MADPPRLLSELNQGDDDELQRQLLASIQRADPPAHAKAEAWARLSTQLGAAALVSSAHGSAATASAAAEGAKAAAGVGVKSAVAPAAFKILGTKAALMLAVAGATTIGVSAAWWHARKTPNRDASSATMPAATRAPTVVAPVLPSPAAVDTTEIAPTPAPDTSVKPTAEQRRRDQLSAESALLTSARAELRKGDARGAQQLLSRLQARFPKGVLGQEREVLAIEVLAARGNAAAAKRRARAFIAAYPESPHSAQLGRFADAP